MTLRDPVAVPLNIQCSCTRPRRIPVSLDAAFWNFLSRVLHNVEIPGDVPVLHVYCRHCGTEKAVTVGELRLDSLPAITDILGV